jgi:hypothetical protein
MSMQSLWNCNNNNNHNNNNNNNSNCMYNMYENFIKYSMNGCNMLKGGFVKVSIILSIIFETYPLTEKMI